MNTEQYKQHHPIGTKVICKVLKSQPFGVFVQLADSVDGLIRVPELALSGPPPYEYPDKYPQIGEELEAYILWYDEGGRISLTQKPQNHQQLEEKTKKCG